MIRFLIADDHTVVRQGLERILLGEFPDAHFLQAGNAEEMLQLATDSALDLVISDLSMPGRSGLDVLHQIKELKPGLPVLILSIHPEEHYAVRALKAGASGYLSKDMAPEELIRAVHAVLSGRKYITPVVAEKLAEQLGHGHSNLPHELLSDREFAVFKLLAKGKSITDIAATLQLRGTTVSTYRARILEKMNLHNNADITMYAIEKKLL